MYYPEQSRDTKFNTACELAASMLLECERLGYAEWMRITKNDKFLAEVRSAQDAIIFLTGYWVAMSHSKKQNRHAHLRYKVETTPGAPAPADGYRPRIISLGDCGYTIGTGGSGGVDGSRARRKLRHALGDFF